MTIVTQTGERRVPRSKNTFWIGANLLFDTVTGATNQVLLFVHSEAEAAIFNKNDAENYLKFVSSRAERFGPGIVWTLQDARRLPGRYIIKGEQDVF